MKTPAVNDYWLNPAYLGTRVDKDRDGKETVTLQICAWCPVEDVRRLEAYARCMSWDKSHGVCPACLAVQLKSLDLPPRPSHV